MSRIFLSHSSSNNAAALALASWLDSQGWNDYFLDISNSRGIAPGERWMAALAGAVDRCEAVIFLVSPAWRDSKFCFAEFYQAKNLGKRIFGVIVEPIALSELPDQMTAEWQVCDLTHSDDPVAFTVERAPVVPTTVVHFPAFGLDALARGLRKSGLDPSTFVWPPDGDPDRSPYPGLRALDEPDAAVFYGRDASIVRAIDQIRLVSERGVERLFVILGASGAGKSSFLRAGLLPRLRRDSDHFLVLPPIRPERAAISGTQGLMASLKKALTAIGQASSQAQLRSELGDTGLAGVLRRITARPQMPDAAHGAPGRTVLVLIDQAEELFSSDGADEAQQLLQHVETLRQELAAGEPALQGERLRVLLVATIRSDSLPRLQADTGLQRLSPVLFSLPAMPRSEFKSVIEGPARRHTETVKPLVVDPQLAEELVADANGADALPLLALTLEWLFREFTTPQGTHIGHDEYKRLGGVRGVINMAVERALEQPGREPAIPAQRSEQQQLLEQVFPFIATVDPDTGEWKRRVALRGAIGDAAPHADAVVQRLIEQRLLRADSRQLDEAVEPVAVVEVAHEALLRQWDALDRWLRSFAADLAAGEAVRRSAKHWQRGQRDEVLLVHTGHRLQAAEALLLDERLKGRFEPIDSQYLSACRERDNRVMQEREDQLRQVAEQQAKRAALQRWAGWGLSGGAIVVLALMSWIVLQTRELGRQTSLALANAAEVATNRNEFDSGVRLAVLAAQSTWLQPADATARPALSVAADSNALRLLLVGHTGSVSSASFSPDGKHILTASEDKSVRVWNAETGEPVGLPMTHAGQVDFAGFSQDGKRVLTASAGTAGRTALVWDATTGHPVGAQMSHGTPVSSASFSPDGKRVVTVSKGRTARVWEVETSQPVGAPMTHGGRAVYSTGFGPDGKRVFTVSGDNTVRVLDAETGQPIGAPITHDETVSSARISPDGKRIITASILQTRVWDVETGQPIGSPIRETISSASFSRDGKRVIAAESNVTARIWDADTGQPVGPLIWHSGSISSTSFSPDGKRVVTATDRTALIREVETGQPVGATMTHDRPVSSARFSPDGKRAITASADKSARVWDAEIGVPVGEPMTHGESVYSASFSPNGKRVLTRKNQSVSVWDLATGKPVGSQMTHDKSVSSASFSPNGKRVVTASGTTGRVWDAETAQPLGAPMTHGEWVSSASFSPDGKRIVTASWDHTARVWDAGTGEPVGVVMAHDWVTSATFSPDGKRVVTASQEGTVRVWDAVTGLPLGAEITRVGPVSNASFNADGKRVVTASEDGTARLWDATTGLPLGAPMTHVGPVSNASFSADGKRVVTASEDGTARIWDAATGKPVGAPMKHHESVYSARFSADGKRVVTASGDRTARIWDAATAKPVGAPMKHHKSVYSASFSPDGKLVVTASEDGSARIWRTDWSMFGNTTALMAAACAQMNPVARRITLEDRAMAPQISPDLLGQDVCEIVGLAPAN